ncbi:MAG: hypothetical protein JNK26_02185 [Candidatus Doudnabacteria bacterium]|nr:hypothetical protein [Candidatus Doudnabacteria bacterium]
MQKLLRPLKTLVISCILFVSFVQPVAALNINAGVIADSCCDEYRADDNRGGAYAATTLNWVELLAKYRRWNFGPWGQWGGVRRTGFEYNWSRSAATTTDMINNKQHIGLAASVSQGKIDLVIIFIGSNDFAYYRSDGYAPIYSGSWSESQIQAKLDLVYNNIKTAVDTIQQAGSPHVIVAGVPDWGLSPVVVAQFPDATKRQKVSNYMNQLNFRIGQYVEANGGLFLEVNQFAKSLLAKVTSSGKLLVGGEEINLLSVGDEPHHVTLGDGIHSGTVFGGLFANYIVGSANARWGLSERLFEEDEILQAAGIILDSFICAADINRDGVVDLYDYSLVVADLLGSIPVNQRTDVDGNGLVDLEDYSLLVARLLAHCLTP